MIQNNLSFYMKRERYSNNQFAELMGMTPQHMSKIVVGRTKGIDYEFWDKAHKILKLKPNESLFKYVPDKKGD